MIEDCSPFPGMDPYLEPHWRDVHHRLCTYAADALQPQLRPHLLARLDERRVVKTEPLIIRGESEPAFEGFIQIIDAATGGKLVTVIEFLSPSNKHPGEGQMQYRQKQRELAAASVSLVEIDLLRGGQYLVQTPRNRVPRTPYRVSMHRGWKKDEYEYYPIRLDERLPVIRIPLRQQDADAKLDLQALIDLIYRNGAYDQIDYRRPLVPPLEGEDLAWAEMLLRPLLHTPAGPVRNDEGRDPNVERTQKPE